MDHGMNLSGCRGRCLVDFPVDEGSDVENGVEE
jgi:hypothetical protein